MVTDQSQILGILRPTTATSTATSFETKELTKRMDNFKSQWINQQRLRSVSSVNNVEFSRA